MNDNVIPLTPRIKPQVRPTGPHDADVMLVGEAPGVNEVKQGVPFIGESGKELDRMLHEAGLLRSDCFITNVCRVRPPRNKIDNFYLKKTAQSRIPGPEISQGIEDLKQEIRSVKPKVIVAFGDTSLWALTGESGIGKWRGSQLTYTDGDFSCTLIPTYHPAAVLRMWSWRFATVIDLKRAHRELVNPVPKPQWDFTIRPSVSQAMELLDSIPGGLVACDLETRGGHIACIGFGISLTEAFCIPFMCLERPDGYFSYEEEKLLVGKLREVFQRDDIQWVFQNGLYDVQYIARYWGVVPKVYLDTMLAHHVCFAGLPKGLDFLSSIYCEYHRYWKDDGKTWDKNTGEEQLWTYNCEDCVKTYECAIEILRNVNKLGLVEQVEFQMKQFHAVFLMMLRGVNCDLTHKAELVGELTEARGERDTWIETALGRPLAKFINSPKQVATFFYDECGIKPIKNRKTGRPTTDDAALEKIKRVKPILRPFIRRLQEARSIGVFLSTFAGMPLDRDGRIRCSYNVAGTETFRYSSSENAFGSGTNLQNVPAGDEDDPDDGAHLLPNVRKIFTPDHGYEFWDADLDRADAQVVAAEANDDILRQMFREGADIHLENAKVIFGNERLTKDSKERKLAKAGVHATNYGSSARTLAMALGITVREAERFQTRWFSAHPGISDWQDRVEDMLYTTRTVVNKFGFRRYYFERIESLLPEALAWIPQSTVALVISRGLVRITEEVPQVHCLLQVHDSLCGQWPKHLRNPMLRAVRDCMLVEIPYDDPLTIPVGFKVSDKSWGHCVDVKEVNGVWKEVA